MTTYDPGANHPFELPFDDVEHGHVPVQNPRAVLADVLQHLTSTFVGDAGGALDGALTTVAILVAKWMVEPYPLRLLVTGSTGVGKSRLLTAISEMTRVPATILPVTQLAEATWSGLQLGDAVRELFPDLFTQRNARGRIVAPDGTIRRRCVFCLDELDKLALVTPDNQPLDGAARAWRLGRQETLLAALDPLSEIPTRLDDVDGTVRWSLADSIVICAGAFPMFGPAEVITPASLRGVGLTGELIDRLGVVLTLPQPSAAARKQLATVAAADMVAFARRLDVEVEGLDALISTLPAPGSPEAPYLGVRGLRHHVERKIADAIAVAVGRSDAVAHVHHLPEPS